MSPRLKSRLFSRRSTIEPQLEIYQKVSENRKKVRERNYTTILLCCTVAFLFADQNLLSPNLSAIAKEFNFSDSERDTKLGGNISFGFFVLGAPAALLVGYLTDSCNRCHLFGCVVILGEVSCLATYWVQTYPQLFACRVLTGISIGGASPVIFSLLADYWPGSSRVRVSTLIGIAMSAGVAGGQLIAGLMGPAYGWRSPFLVVAIPCLLCGLLILTTTVEPSRGAQEEQVLVMRRAREKYLVQPDEGKFLGTVVVTEGSGRSDESENKHSEVKIMAEVGVINPLQLHSPDFSRQIESLERTQTSVTSSPCSKGQNRKNIGGGESPVDDVSYDEKIDCTKVYDIFRTPTVVLIFVQGIPGCLPWGKSYFAIFTLLT